MLSRLKGMGLVSGNLDHKIKVPVSVEGHGGRTTLEKEQSLFFSLGEYICAVRGYIFQEDRNIFRRCERSDKTLNYFLRGGRGLPYPPLLS